MPVLVGTDDGIHQWDTEQWERTTVLDGVDANQIERGAATGDFYAAAGSGLFRSSDGEEWTALDVDDVGDAEPIDAVVSVHETANGRLFAGTRPAHVHRSVDGGEDWERLERFEAIPGKDDWTQNYMGPAQVRDVRSHERAPGKLFVAVETDGVYVGHDYGRTWEYRGRGLDNDPHGLRMVRRDALIATCGRGLYRTDDAGRTWYRLDTHQRHFWSRYFREGILHDGGYYTCATNRSAHSYEDRDPGVLLRSQDGGTTLEAREFPGQGDDYVNAWASVGDRLVAGTVHGRLLVGPDRWELVAELDGTVQSLAAV